MTEIEMTNLEPTSTGYMRLSNVVMREDDGKFAVRPFEEAVRLKVESYVLRADQLPVFEDWFIRENELDIPFYRKAFKRPGMIFFVCGTLLIFPVVSILEFGGSLRLAEALFLMALLFFVLAGVFTFLGRRKKRHHKRASFPFPDAPKVEWNETEMVRWFEWGNALEPQGYLAVWLSMGFAFIFLLGGVVSWVAPDIYGRPNNEGTSLASFFASGVFLLSGLFVLRPHLKASRAFKKEYGKPRTPKNQYLNVVGRLDGET